LALASHFRRENSGVTGDCKDGECVRELLVTRNTSKGTTLELKFNSIRFSNSNPMCVTHQRPLGARQNVACEN
jgi:hypothetical protein